MIRNEFRGDKMDDWFKEEGFVKGKEENDVYEIITSKGKVTRRHASQLKRLRRGKLDCDINPKI